MRFITATEKAIVLAILLAVDGVLMLIVSALQSDAASIVLTLIQLAGWYLVTRVFRGPGERVAAVRPWWRMTNRPLLSTVLGAMYALTALVNLGFSAAGYGSLSGAISILAETLLAALFLYSSVRLRALARVAA